MTPTNIILAKLKVSTVTGKNNGETDTYLYYHPGSLANPRCNKSRESVKYSTVRKNAQQSKIMWGMNYKTTSPVQRGKFSK